MQSVLSQVYNPSNNSHNKSVKQTWSLLILVDNLLYEGTKILVDNLLYQGTKILVDTLLYQGTKILVDNFLDQDTKILVDNLLYQGTTFQCIRYATKQDQSFC